MVILRNCLSKDGWYFLLYETFWMILIMFADIAAFKNAFSKMLDSVRVSLIHFFLNQNRFCSGWVLLLFFGFQLQDVLLLQQAISTPATIFKYLPIGILNTNKNFFEFLGTHSIIKTDGVVLWENKTSRHPYWKDKILLFQSHIIRLRENIYDGDQILLN